ncbi:DUF3047 domain-containing protein [Rhodohalobacter sp. 8-1]|uniref:DUF3047 domain-containing protein n=1 Tax=Rhodohalobacter sp. 8-1 TaxID=3131972 RepID=UPI0030ED190A
MFKIILNALLFTGIIAVTTLHAQEAINSVQFGEDGVVYLEDFEHYEVGTIPDEWYNRDGDGIPANYEEVNRRDYKYKVRQENGNKFLRYEGTEAKHLNFPLIDKQKINIHETPILKWDWRIFDIPEGGDEDSSSYNDVAASVYVVFDTSRILFQKVPVSIRYTWSSKHPVGSVFSKLRGRQRIMVVGTGENNLGEWQTFERNIVEDYENIFGKTPPRTPIAILILSDGDETRSHIKADYDNFELHPAIDFHR